MSEFEINVLELSLGELLTSTIDNLYTAISIFLTLVTAYLVSVFVANMKLSKLQFGIATTLYSLAYLFVSLALRGNAEAAMYLARRLREAEVSVSGSDAADYAWAYLGAAILVFVYTATIWFAFTVRSKNSNGT
ncbi:hypothetical protein R0137_03700 [Congregibacter brevis]|uniref:Uncharacterized protein n=1 Tax=Congregibacter brevis TaxID=3081201 RepID=A0ABZ0IGM5_9GAMM|nr:hypothetical protein R0137_03700 [Congregibacter sp. IMCC45268]